MVFLCVGIFIISCTKDNSIEERKKANQKTHVLEIQESSQAPPCYTTIIEASNSENPFDYGGMWHNAALDHAATLVDVYNVEPNDMYAAIIDFYLNQEISQSFATFLENEEAPPQFLSDDHSDNGLDFLTFKNDYVNENDVVFGNILDDVNSIVFGSYSITDAQSIVNELTSYENNFFSTYQEEDAIKYHSFFSILRHSLKYWTEAYENDCHPYHVMVTTTVNGQSRWISIELLIRLAVDAAHHADCLSNGGLNAKTEQQANDNCFPNSVYASLRAFDGPDLK